MQIYNNSRIGRSADRHPGASDRRCCNLRDPAGVSGDRRRLHIGGAKCGVRRLRARRDTDGDRQYVVGDQGLRTGPAGVHCVAAGLCLLCRSRQRLHHPLLRRSLKHCSISRRSRAGIHFLPVSTTDIAHILEVEPDEQADEEESPDIGDGVVGHHQDRRSCFRALSRQTISTSTTKTKGRAPSAMIVRTASMLSDKIITRPRAPNTTPQPSLTLAEGLRSPPVENMPSTKAALTTLVTINRKAAATTPVIVNHRNGNSPSTKKVTPLTLSRTTSRIGRPSRSAA